MQLYHTKRMSLSDVIACFTTGPARILELDKGTLSVGADADVTVFDWEGVSDHANETGDAAPSGIEHVFVNGRHVLDMGCISSIRGAGHVLTS